MNAALLQTKLYTPSPRPNLVARPRLVERLWEALRSGQRLILVSAPAGSGKTTLLSEWISDFRLETGLESQRYQNLKIKIENLKFCWLSLDEEDNDPVRFWTYWIAALQTRLPGLAQGMAEVLRSPQAPDIQPVITSLLNEIAALPERVALVLDDYHAITEKTIHAGVAYWLEHMPPQCCLAISTRVDPPLPLVRLRARSQMTEVRMRDLRFSPGEAADFLNEIMGLGLTPDDVAALEQRTEGWAVGLQLAALALQASGVTQDRAGTQRFIQAFSGTQRHILDYLAEEVIERQPEGVQEFLLNTSILERMCGPLCDAVMGDGETGDRGLAAQEIPYPLPPSPFPNGQAILEYLERANLFLVPLDDERRWYRYHHLFSELLRARLKSRRPESAPALHLRAAEWHQQAGLAAEAVSHTLAAREFERAAGLIERHTTTVLARGEMSTLRSWIKALPEAVVIKRPRLCVALGWILTFAGELHTVEPLLQQAERTLGVSAASHDQARDVFAPDSPPATQIETTETRDILGNIASMRAFIAGIAGEDARAIQLAQQAARLLPEEDYIARSVIPFTQGRSYRSQGDLERAAQAFVELVQVAESASIWTLAVAWFELASTCKIQGRLRQAEAIYREALRRIEEQGAARYGTVAKVDSGLADLLREWGDLENARRMAVEALERMKTWGNPHDLVIGYTTLARILESLGDIEAGLAVLEQADLVRRRFHLFPPLASMIDTGRVRLWLAQGNLEQAGRWLRESRPGQAGTPLIRELEQITQARLLLAQGEADQAANLLSRLAQAAEAGERTGRLIEMLALLAIALSEMKESTRALQVLEKCLALAEPQGYMRIFLDEGEKMREMILDFRLQIEKRAQAGRPEATGALLAYADRLLAAFPAPDQISLPQSKISDLKSKILAPLSERELEVLRLVAAGLTNRQIAQRIVVAESTVKKHINHIYDKLAVRSRTQAIARARELGLL